MTATHIYSTREGTLAARTALCLGRSDLLAVPLQAGDSLRSERGTVWITVDGLPQDILLEPGQEHFVPEAGAVNVSALQSACVSVRSSAPLAWRRISPDAAPAWARLAQRVLTAVTAGARMPLHGFYNLRSAAPAAGR